MVPPTGLVIAMLPSIEKRVGANVTASPTSDLAPTLFSPDTVLLNAALSALMLVALRRSWAEE